MKTNGKKNSQKLDIILYVKSRIKNNSGYCICGQQSKGVQEYESIHHLRVQSSELWETQRNVATLENRV